jgi:hypothetical protein
MDRFDLLQFEDAQQMFERRAKEAEIRNKKLAKIEDYGYCEGMFHECRSKKNVEWIPASTCYRWDKEKDPEENPNRDIFLCPVCAKEYTSHWDEMWSEYYHGLL